MGLLSLLLTRLSYLPYIPTNPPSSLKSTFPHCIHSFLCLALGPHPPSLTSAVYVTNFFSLESLRSQKFSRGRWGPLSFSPTHDELLPGLILYRPRTDSLRTFMIMDAIAVMSFRHFTVVSLYLTFFLPLLPQCPWNFRGCGSPF